MDESLSFQIGIGDYVSLGNIDFEGSPDNFTAAGGFLRTKISIRVGAFNGAYLASVRMDDLQDFLNQLKSLYQSLDGKAHFSCLEDWLQIEIEGDKNGHFQAACIADDNKGNRLYFTLFIDQTDLKDSIYQLKQVISAFDNLS